MRLHYVLRSAAVLAAIFCMVPIRALAAADAAKAPAAPAKAGDAAAPATGADETIAKVEGDAITRKDLDDAIRKAIDMYRQLAASGQAPQGFDPNAVPTDEQKRKVLDGLITLRIVDKLAKKANITVTDTEIDDRIKMLKDRQGIKSDEDLQKMLQQRNFSVDQLKAQLREDLARQHFAEQTTKDIKVTDAEIEDAYNKMKAAGQMVLKEDSIDVASILVRVNGNDEKLWNDARKKIDAIRERVTKGKEDFIKVAKEASEDPNVAQNGGIYPYVLRKSAPFGADFGVAAFAVPPGEVSEPFKTGAGWHIVKIVAKHEPGPLPLENAFVKDNIKNRVLAAKSKEAMDKIIADARAAMQIEILLPTTSAPQAPVAPPSAPDASKKDATPNSLLTPGST